MTVADNYDIEKQETNGTTKIFSFNFYTASKDFVKVILEVDGEQSIVPTTDYTIKLNTIGGTVTFTRAPAGGGYIIITRETPREQETSFATSSGFPAKTVEGRFDKLTAMIQEMQDTDNRTPSFPVGTDLNVTLPLPEAGKALVWNDTEDNLENSETTFDEIVSDAISAKNDAVAAKEDSELAKGQAEQARDDAQAAQGYAESAKTAAEYAQSQAESAVSGFDDHVESKKLEVNQLVGQAEGYATSAENSAIAASGSAGEASGYKTDAQTAAGNAGTSATNASVWAEGTDQQVSALGGTHSAKRWAEINAESLDDYTKTEDLAPVALSNSYNDLDDKPTIPTQASDIHALPDTTKYGASLSLSVNSSTYVMAAQLKDQDGNNLGNSQTVDLPIESMVVSAEYDDDTKEIVLTLQSGSTTRFSVADLVSGLQTEITAQNKLDSDLVDDTNQTNKFVTAAEKTTWNGKVSDTTVDGTSVVNNGVAVIPVASQGGATPGLVKIPSTAYGLYINSTGFLMTYAANTADIDSKTSTYRPVVPANLDYATKRGLAYNSLTLTDAEKASACSFVGALPNNIYGESTTAAATVQKEVSIPSITSLNAGQLIIVKPTVTSTVANSTLKLNNFDAYPMLYGGVAITTSTDSYVWIKDVPGWWLFDGSNWLFAGHGTDINTTYNSSTFDLLTAGTNTTNRLISPAVYKDSTFGAVTAYASGDTITPADKYLYTSTADISALTVNAPTSPDVRYVSQINFSSGTTATTLSYPNTFKIYDGCDDVQVVNGVKVFIPVANKRYQVWLFNDGVNTLIFAKGA